MRRVLGLVSFLLFLPSVHAGLFDDDEARKRIADLSTRVDQQQRAIDERLVSLETIVKSQGLVDLLSQLENLRGEISKLRGQIEVLTHEIDNSQKRQRDLYIDLDTRLRKLETPPSNTTTGDANAPLPGGALPARPAVATVDITAEQRAYDVALEQFKAGKYSESVGDFQRFVKTYPKSPLAPSALYWVGNAQYALRDYKNAMASQRSLLTSYPDSQKVPDALLNIASCQTELGELKAARRTLDEIIAKYPQSEAAEKAKRRLAGR